MGMSSNQLLSLTCRQHDIELESQRLMNVKLSLATDNDVAYIDYTAACDASKIQMRYLQEDGSYIKMDATFNNLCSYDSNNMNNQFALIDSQTNKLYVEERVAKMYEQFKNGDKYSFAWTMLGIVRNFSYEDQMYKSLDYIGEGIMIGFNTQADDDNDGNIDYLLMTGKEQSVFENNANDYLKELYSKTVDVANDSNLTLVDKNNALNRFRSELYAQLGREIYAEMLIDTQATQDPENPEYLNFLPEEFPKQEFEYYLKLFDEIEAHAGCIPLEEKYQSGKDGHAWLNQKIKNGQVLIEMYNKDLKRWVSTSVATNTANNSLNEVDDDDAIRQAEVEYQHELSLIQKKEARIDNQLAKLETELSAIKQQREGLKQVIKDNVDRTFGIFS